MFILFCFVLQVQSILFNLTSTGLRHRDHAITGSVLSAHVNSGLKEYFFGKNMEKRLTAKRFTEFQRKLQQEVMLLEVCMLQLSIILLFM